jgi:cytochrome c oxidase assembly protein subunit 15
MHTQAQLVQPSYYKAVIVWLSVCLLLIACMVMLGGYTRLSGSGLSITEWKPIHGSIPPLNESEWQEEFEKYRQIPQYQQINKGMSLDEFKSIYWPEFWHRNLGRLIGIVFALPLAWFYFRRHISKPFAVRLFAIFALGGLQGFMGWIMVASGLKDLVFVSHLKLAMHLGLAFIIFGAILWALWNVITNHTPYGNIKKETATKYFAIFLALLFTQIIFGAFMAGLHAGLIYNSFPLMNNALIPPETFDFQGIWTENIALIQFIHRWLAKFLCLYLILWWWIFKDCASYRLAKRWFFALICVLFVQFILGVLTLVKVTPLHLALMHQIVGLVLFGVAVSVFYHLCRHSQSDTAPSTIR